MVFLVLLVCCMFVVPARTVLERWSASRDYPYQLDIEEGYVLNQAVSIARLQSIYQPIDSPPWLVGNYPPLFPALFALINGDRIGLVSLPAGRMLVQVNVLACLLMLGLAVGLCTRRVDLALLSMFLFMATYELNQWSAFVRVDFAALMFTLAGLAVFLRVEHRAGMIVSSLFFTCAIFTKQTALLAPLACLISLLVTRRHHAPWFILPGLVIALFLSCCFHAVTDGEFFRHLVTYNHNEMRWGELEKWLVHVWFFYRWWICAMFLLAIIRVVRLVLGCGRDETRQVGMNDQDHNRSTIMHAGHVADIYFALAVLSMVSLAKAGSSTNYLLEPLAAASLWTGLTLGKHRGLIRRGSRKGARAWLPGFCLLGVVLLIGLHGATMAVGRDTIRTNGWMQRPWVVKLARLDPFDSSTQPRVDHARAPADELNLLLRKAEGGIFSEEPIFTMLADRPVLHQPFIMRQLAEEGKWDQTPFLQMIREGAFEYFVTTDDLREVRASYTHYTGEMGKAVRESFVHCGAYRVPDFKRTWHAWQYRPGQAATTAVTQ